ncbi:MAG: hypothetical protein ACRDIC_15840, partial [bacterium]
MRAQQAHREEIQPSRRQVLEQHRKPPDRPRCLDAVVGCVLGETEHVRAILEQRGVAFREIQPSLIKLREMDNEGDRGLPFAPREIFHLGK